MTTPATPAPAPAAAPMTYEQFLDSVDEDTRAEFVEGRIVVSSPVSRDHQRIGRFLVKCVSEFVEVRGLGEVFYESFQMKTGPELPGREPDLLFVATENLARVRRNFLDGPGDLVVEIISPESFARDRGDKFREYEQGGVREYWLVDPQRRRAEFHQRGDDGFYVPVLPDASGVYHSAVLEGLTLRVDWLWQDPPPRLPDVLREWGLI
jgi:Uma2 family endonuclease